MIITFNIYALGTLLPTHLREGLLLYYIRLRNRKSLQKNSRLRDHKINKATN